jgi:hypothetical protein
MNSEQSETPPDFGTSRLLTPQELITHLRGAVTITTLANWRFLGRGPRFLKIGHKVRYQLKDVLEWQEQQRRQSEPINEVA